MDLTPWTVTAAGLLTLVAVAHSLLGERDVVAPLLSQRWSIPDIPRPAADRLLRFAWHLTSVAWLGLAAVAIGVRPLVAVGLAGAASAVVTVVALRAHFAWPLFLLVGFAAGVEAGALGTGTLRLMASAGIVALITAAALHLYWAAGGRRALRAAVPTTADGSPLFHPGPAMTAAVAVALLVLAGAMAVAMGADPADPAVAAVAGPPSSVAATDAAATVATWVVVVGTLGLAARAVGDGRYAGFTKSVRGTTFARLDDRVYTPLVVLLALAGLSALIA